ncbi:MAG: hypothetical protein ABIH37_04380 [archaeon]
MKKRGLYELFLGVAFVSSLISGSLEEFKLQRLAEHYVALEFGNCKPPLERGERKAWYNSPGFARPNLEKYFRNYINNKSNQKP